MDKREKEQLSELENKYSSKKNSLSSDKNKAISDSEQKLLENENHYKRMSSQIELDAKNYKRAGASDKEVSESLERNKRNFLIITIIIKIDSIKKGMIRLRILKIILGF